MEFSDQQGNLRTNQEDERIELDELLMLTTTNKTDTDKTMPTKQTGEAESATAVEVPITTKVDPKLHAEKVSDCGDSMDQSCCTCGMPTKQTGEAESATTVEVPITTEVDPKSHTEKDSDSGDSDDQSCCTCGK